MGEFREFCTASISQVCPQVAYPSFAPQVNAGLLTSGVMALYMVFLCYSAIMRLANAPSSGLILKACMMYLSSLACMVIFHACMSCHPWMMPENQPTADSASQMPFTKTCYPRPRRRFRLLSVHFSHILPSRKPKANSSDLTSRHTTSRWFSDGSKSSSGNYTRPCFLPLLMAALHVAVSRQTTLATQGLDKRESRTGSLLW